MKYPREKLMRWTVHILLCIAAFIFIWTGLGGIDFGKHWDEENRFIAPVYKSVETGNLLPREYWYPSFVHDVALLSLIPDALTYSLFYRQQGGLRGYLQTIVPSHSFLIRLRVITVLFSSLTLLWVYLLVFSWQKNRQEALIASLLVGFSWEVAYHSRWLTVDPILMQFGMLTMMCLEFSRNHPKGKNWLRGAAVAAGLACGTKYQGAFLLLPLSYATFLHFENKGMKTVFTAFIEVLFIFGLTCLLVTPGTLLDAGLFVKHLKFIIHLYKHGNSAYALAPGLQHFWLNLDYLGSVALSKNFVTGWIFLIFAVVGFVSLNNKLQARAAALFLSFPLFYVIYVSSQKLMIVRNLLILIPFLAVLSARGIFFLQSKIAGGPFRRWLLPGTVMTLLAINAMGLIGAMRSIQHRHETNYLKELANFMDRHTEIRFLMTERLENDLRRTDSKYASAVVNPFGKNTVMALYSLEVERESDRWRPIANKRDARITVFGPEEINFNYYPTWSGDERIIVIPIETALSMGIGPKPV